MEHTMFAFYRRSAAKLVLLLAGLAGWQVSAGAQEMRVRPPVWVDFGDTSFLGIQMEDVTADNMATYKLASEKGVIVRTVEKGSPAEEAKLLENDVIVEYEGVQVLSSMQLARMVRETPPGRRVDLGVSRAGKKLVLTVKMRERGHGAGFQGRRMEIPSLPDDNRFFNFVVPDSGVFSVPGNQPRLGITVQPLTDQLASFLGVPGKKGALVASVLEGQPAYNKLRAGDVITRAADQPVDGPEDLIRIVRQKEAGTIDLRIIRDKKEMTVTLDISKGESPPGRGYRL